MAGRLIVELDGTLTEEAHVEQLMIAISQMRGVAACRLEVPRSADTTVLTPNQQDGYMTLVFHVFYLGVDAPPLIVNREALPGIVEDALAHKHWDQDKVRYMRAYYGLPPYAERRRLKDVADEFGVSTGVVKRGIEYVRHYLRHPAHRTLRMAVGIMTDESGTVT